MLLFSTICLLFVIICLLNALMCLLFVVIRHIPPFPWFVSYLPLCVSYFCLVSFWGGSQSSYDIYLYIYIYVYVYAYNISIYKYIIYIYIYICIYTQNTSGCLVTTAFELFMSTRGSLRCRPGFHSHGGPQIDPTGWCIGGIPISGNAHINDSSCMVPWVKPIQKPFFFIWFLGAV